MGLKRVYVDGSTTQTCTVIDGVARVLPAGKIGEKVTNNQGEYLAVIVGLQRACLLGLKEIEILSDSQLVVKQLNHQYKIKNLKLGELARQARGVMRGCFDYGKVKFTWIPREENPAGEVLG